MAEKDIEALRKARESFLRKRRRAMAEQMAPAGAACRTGEPHDRPPQSSHTPFGSRVRDNKRANSHERNRHGWRIHRNAGLA